jgi:hypothetical protein
MTHTLDTAVREYLLQSGDDSPARYQSAYTAGFAAFRELGFDVSGVPQVHILELSDTDSALLPDGYIRWTRVGALIGGNKIVDLGINNNLLPPGTVVNNCGNNTIATQTSAVGGNNAFWPYFYGGGSYDSPADNWRNGEFMGRLFGAGGGTNANGYFKVFPENGTIQFENPRSREIIMECLVDAAADASGNFVIHPFLIEPIKAGAHWNMIKFNKYVSGSEKASAEGLWLKAKRHAKSQFLAPNIDTFYQFIRAANSPSPKM